MVLARTTKGLALFTLILSLKISLAFPQAGAGDKLKISIPSNDNVLSTLGNATRLALPSSRFNFLVWNLHKGSDKTFKTEFLALASHSHIIKAQEMYTDHKMIEVF